MLHGEAQPAHLDRSACHLPLLPGFASHCICSKTHATCVVVCSTRRLQSSYHTDHAADTHALLLQAMWQERRENAQAAALHKPMKNKATLSFLTDGYNERFYWWECVVMLRKVHYTATPPALACTSAPLTIATPVCTTHSLLWLQSLSCFLTALVGCRSLWAWEQW